MLKSKDDLYKCMDNISWGIITNKKDFAAICELCYKKYNLPVGKTADILNCKIPCEEANVFELFCVLDCVNEVREKKVKLEQYFTDSEIKHYSSSKYEDDKIKFPLVFKMVQIAHDQWIGRISANELMQMRDAQLINYNENAQRTMQYVVKGNRSAYRISINASAIKAIKESLVKGIFIPNTITLNIPNDVKADYYYSEEKCEFVVNSIEHFDITDGYH